MALGEPYLVSVRDKPVGTLRFQLEHADFWPDSPGGESAFIHRLTVRRAFSGGTAAEALLSFAANHARKLGPRYLRPDCDRSRERLRRVYEEYGFTYDRDWKVGRFEVARYQLDLGSSE